MTQLSILAILKIVINGLDILVLLKTLAHRDEDLSSKELAEQLFIEPSEITRSWKRTRTARLSFLVNRRHRVNQAGLLELLLHGFQYVFPAERGPMTRGIPTGVAAEPMKSAFADQGESPVWPYADGKLRGYSLKPLHRQAPKAALKDPKLYELLALVDAIRGDRIRERAVAGEELKKRFA